MDDVALEQIRTAYSTVAGAYDEVLADTAFEAEADQALVARLVDGLGAGGGAAVLDAGCGTGRMLTHLRDLDPSLRLTGVDLAPGMVDRARARHPDLSIEVADLAALPFEDEHFDGVLSWYSVIHTPEAGLSRVFSELRRVLRSGGLALLGFHAGTGQRRTQSAYGHDVELVTQLHGVPRVAAALTAGGFAVEERLERPARPVERGPQGFVLARRG